MIPNADVARMWAHQSDEHGKSGNMFFRGKSIYSYGDHFEIARMLDGSTVLFTTRDYSVTTSAHKSHVRNALSSTYKTVFYVPHVDITVPDAHAKNLAYLVQETKRLRGKALRARKHAELWRSEAYTQKQKAAEYVNTFSRELETEREHYALFFKTDLFDDFAQSVMDAIDVANRITKENNDNAGN